MRQALGLRNGASNQRVPQRREAEQRGRRFVKDGEVQVVVVNRDPNRDIAREMNRETHRDAGGDLQPQVNRAAAAEAALRNERAAREHAERSLAEAQTTIQHLQTKLAHADMAHHEALNVERGARELAETALHEANVRREAAEQKLAEQVLAASLAPPREARPRPIYKSELAVRGAPVRVPRKTTETPEEEPEPVQWWLPSFRAKSRKGT